MARECGGCKDHPELIAETCPLTEDFIGGKQQCQDGMCPDGSKCFFCDGNSEYLICPSCRAVSQVREASRA